MFLGGVKQKNENVVLGVKNFHPGSFFCAPNTIFFGDDWQCNLPKIKTGRNRIGENPVALALCFDDFFTTNHPHIREKTSQYGIPNDFFISTHMRGIKKVGI